MRLILLLCLILSGCAPMPGPELWPGLTEPTPIEQVDVTITIGLVETVAECNSRMAWHQVALGCLLNFCIPMGCSTAHWDDTGKIYKCEIWAVADWDWIIDHELKHCEGYRDKLY